MKPHQQLQIFYEVCTLQSTSISFEGIQIFLRVSAPRSIALVLRKALNIFICLFFISIFVVFIFS